MRIAARILSPVAACFAIVLLGCSVESKSSLMEITSDTSSLQCLTTNELTQLLRSSSKPVLVEFSVPVGCARCNQMQPQIRKLASQVSERAELCLINFNYERQLVNELGITVCPTYIAFVDGREVFRTSHPTSGDLLLARLQDLTEQQ